MLDVSERIDFTLLQVLFILEQNLWFVLTSDKNNLLFPVEENESVGSFLEEEACIWELGDLFETTERLIAQLILVFFVDMPALLIMYRTLSH